MCTLMPPGYHGAELICISGVSGGSQQLTVWTVKMSLTRKEWQKQHMVTVLEAPRIAGLRIP